MLLNSRGIVIRVVLCWDFVRVMNEVNIVQLAAGLNHYNHYK